jgi:hypothetical protein
MAEIMTFWHAICSLIPGSISPGFHKEGAQPLSDVTGRMWLQGDSIDF